ncbi:MAG: DUF1667 domain-containing protein [Oscillospiraceae bacterium]|jgi:CxxC motif-containing protein|nr:DUF1667 domain-containing protein [Oscillospiraceae bacterium]
MTELICITCPAGCKLLAELTPGGGVNVTGNACKRGVDFALAELTHPMRTLCSTVRTAFAECPMIPVRTDREIPKGKMHEVMRLLTGVVVDQRVACGDAVVDLSPICEGNMIATSDWLMEV